MRTCQVFFRPEAIYVFPDSETVTGIRIANEPFSKLERNCEVIRLGLAVMQALQFSRTGISQPKDVGNVTKAILEFTGFKSWGRFAKEAFGVLIESNDMEIRVIPMKANKDGSFGFLSDQSVKCSLDPNTLGETIFDFST